MVGKKLQKSNLEGEQGGKMWRVVEALKKRSVLVERVECEFEVAGQQGME